jgi:cytochrome c-type biogenesis protein CcmE
MRRTGLIIGLIIIVSTLAFSMVVLKKSLVNYVSFNDARLATDSTVRIIGSPVAGTMFYDQTASALKFSISDEKGVVMPVVYHGPKPEDLDTAMSKAAKITAEGSFDPGQHVFTADNLLVKCPSKYQGDPNAQERSYGATKA